ncbi:MAG: hypothetical protein J6U26_00675 [Lachnospiraceae bacterium]|nr:hypothetical protein [Lachnospiraceae bacterium]
MNKYAVRVLIAAAVLLLAAGFFLWKGRDGARAEDLAEEAPVYTVAEGSLFESRFPSRQAGEETVPALSVQRRLELSEQYGAGSEVYANLAAPSFADLTDAQVLKIAEALPAVSTLPLFEDGKAGTVRDGYYYLGTYGDGCAVVYQKMPEPVICILGELQVGETIFGGWFRMYVLRGTEWMGVNVAFELGYMSQEDLHMLNIAMVKAVYRP